ncbi:hypothetical protein [Novosphingobium terrae]|uniref:hypothetical protein n=1 Tax=Novosphingobium terrae TaxID=2726189 RepID=UPI0019814D32|nr:hypothetical protein [Novosphingobium terrae]
MSEFAKPLDHGRYTITVPTYERHFSRFHDFIESINLYCADKNLLDIIVVVESHNVLHIETMALQFPELNVRTVTTEHSLEIFNINERPSRFLSRVGKFTFQSIKKFGGLLHSATQWAIVLDSETLFVKSFSIADLVQTYAANPYVFYTKTDRRGDEWRNSLVDNVTTQCSSIMECDHPGRNYMELIFWFFDVSKVHAFMARHGSDLNSFLASANPSMPIFENIMIYIFLQNNYEGEYNFVDFEEAWRSTVSPEIAQRYDLKKAPLSFLGADHATYTLRPSEVAKIAPFFDAYHVPFFRLEPFFISAEYLTEFLKIPSICCFVSSAHIPWLRKKIAICITGEFRNPALTFDKVRHLSGFLTGCDYDLYLHGWHHPDEAVIIESLQPKASLFEHPPRHMFKEIDARIRHREPNVRPGRDIGSLAMFYSMERCFELVEASGEDYDFIIKLRPDVFFELPLWEILRAISAEGDLNRNSLYVPRGFHSQGLNDQIAIGGTDAMRVYMTTYSYARERVEDIYFNPEHILSLNMLNARMNIVQFHLNYALMRGEGYHPENITRILHAQHGVWWSAPCLFPAFENANTFFSDKAKATRFALDRPKALERLYISQGFEPAAVLELRWADLNPTAHLHKGEIRAQGSSVTIGDRWHFAGIRDGQIEEIAHVDRNVFVWKDEDRYVVVEWAAIDGKFERHMVSIQPDLAKEVHAGEAWSGRFLPTDFVGYDDFVADAQIATEKALLRDLSAGSTFSAAVFEGRVWNASELSVGDGERLGDRIALIGCDGLVSYGPYAQLPAGGYMAHVVLGDLEGQGKLELSITADCGARRLAKCLWFGEESLKISFPFLANEEVKDLELAVHNAGFARVSVRSLTIVEANQAFVPALSIRYAPWLEAGAVAGLIARNRLYTNGKAGDLARVPIVDLEPGRYVVRMIMDDVLNLGNSAVEVRRAGALLPIRKRKLKDCSRNDEGLTADFLIEGRNSNVSVIVKVDKNAIFAMKSIRIEAV